MGAREVFDGYFASLVAGDMDRLAGLLADDIVWHQPGDWSLAGTHTGREAVMQLLGEFMTRSGGTFRLEPQDVMVNGDSVAVTVHFSAQRPGREPLDMTGVDVLRTSGGQITEMWLYSQDQSREDAFWA